MKEFYRRLSLLTAIVVTLFTVLGCGGGGGGGNTPDPTITQSLGSWEGTMTVTATRGVAHRALGDQLSVFAQFLVGLPGKLGNSGTMIKTIQSNAASNPGAFLQQIGQFTSTVTGVGTMALTGKFPYDANGLPSTTVSQPFNANVTLANGKMQGTFTSGNDSGTITLTQKTTSTAANKNVQGSWIGNTANQGGFTVTGTTTPPTDFTLTIGTQDASNALSGITVSSPDFSPNPFPIPNGGLAGSTVTLSGFLPAGLNKIGVFDFSNQPYGITATIDPSNPNRLTGTFLVKNIFDPSGDLVPVGAFIAYRQTTTPTPTPTPTPVPTKNPTIFVADATRVVAMDDMTGKNATTNILSGKTPYHIQDMAIGPNGHLYIADYPQQIEEFDGTGKFVTAYQPSSPPSHIFVDQNGKIYWRDDNLTINRIDDMKGTNKKTLGGTDTLHFANPAGIATDTAGFVYIAEAQGNYIMRFDPDMTPGSMKTFGHFGGGPGQFDMHDPSTYESPGHAIAIDQQNKVYVADFNNGRVVRFDADALNNPANANVSTIPMETLRSTTGILARPLGVTVDKANPPHIYITTEEQPDRTKAVTSTFLIQVYNFAIPGWDADPIITRYGGKQAPPTGQLGFFHDPEAVAVK